MSLSSPFKHATAAVLFLLFLNTPFTLTQEPEDQSLESLSLSELQKKLDQRMETLQSLRSSYYQTLEQLKKTQQKEQNKQNQLKLEVQQLKKQQASKQKQIQKKQTTHDQRSDKVQQLESEKEEIQALSEQFEQQLLNHIRLTVPYQLKNRKTEITRTREQPLPERLNHLWNISMGEFEDSRSSAQYNQQITLPDGRKKHGHIVRIGHRILFFVTEDGQNVGIQVRKKGKWTWSPVENKHHKEQFRKALQILQGREEPRFLPLPIQIISFDEERK